MRNKKQTIQCIIHNIPLHTYYSGSLSKLVKELADLLAEHPTCEYFLKDEEVHDNEHIYNLVLAKTRLETNEEYARRLDKIEDNKRLAFEYAKQTYLSLKDKYEPTS